MLTSNRRPPLSVLLVGIVRQSREAENLHNGEDLEEVVLGEILVGVVWVERPEIVDHDVEDAEDYDEHDGAPLGLESNDDHDASDETKKADSDSPEVPVTAENEAHKEEDEQDTAR
jgi:hypothetical protein